MELAKHGALCRVEPPGSAGLQTGSLQKSDLSKVALFSELHLPNPPVEAAHGRDFFPASSSAPPSTGPESCTAVLQPLR
jgi:hypothetical protein